MTKWVKLPWFKYHKISDTGEIMLSENINRYKKGRICKPEITKKGYSRIKLYGKKYMVHRLVAEAFVPNPENKPEVNHKNGNRSDNNAKNLEWVTRIENIMYSIHILKNKIGGKGGRNKRPIKSTDGNKFVSRNECARYYGVNGSVISYAISHNKPVKGNYLMYIIKPKGVKNE